MPQYLQEYTAAAIDKIAYLKSVHTPKIILVGNSNVAFGFDSKLIEDRIGMPVVNLGMHGGLGNTFHENMAKFNIDEGDIVILCHTSYDDDGTIGDTILAWTLIENHYELYKLIDKKDVVNMVKAFPSYLSKSINLWSNMEGNSAVAGSAYQRNAFNQYGDVSFNRPQNADNLDFTNKIVVPGLGNECIKNINSLNKYVLDKKATLLIAGYPIANCEYTPDEKLYEDFQESLEQRVDCTIISDFTDYFFGPEYFFDTVYHLTNDGAQKRSELLVEDLERYFEAKNSKRSEDSE